MSSCMYACMYVEFEEILKPEFVAPIVAYLCHEDCQDTGGVFEVHDPSPCVISSSLIYMYLPFSSVLEAGHQKVRLPAQLELSVNMHIYVICSATGEDGRSYFQ